jgi:hypothetical protein
MHEEDDRLDMRQNFDGEDIYEDGGEHDGSV